MKKVTLNGKQKCGLGFVWLIAGIFGLMLSISGCDNSDSNAPTTIVEAPEAMTWEYQIGDKVLHKSGVLGVVVDMHFSGLPLFGHYAMSEGKWNGKKMQCYRIRVPSENGFTKEWVSALELEGVPDE